MNCPTDEILRALLDGELAPAESAAVHQHIAECPACQSRSKAVSAAAARVGTLLGSLDVPASSAESNPQMALARFKARLNPQEQGVPLLSRIFAPRWRFAWAPPCWLCAGAARASRYSSSLLSFSWRSPRRLIW